MLRSLAATLLAAAIAPCSTPDADAGIRRAAATRRAGCCVLLAPAYPEGGPGAGRNRDGDRLRDVQTDGRPGERAHRGGPPSAAFEVGRSRQVVPLWRLQPRIVPPGVRRHRGTGRVTIWFEIADGKPKVRYAAARRTGPTPGDRTPTGPPSRPSRPQSTRRRSRRSEDPEVDPAGGLRGRGRGRLRHRRRPSPHAATTADFEHARSTRSGMESAPLDLPGAARRQNRLADRQFARLDLRNERAALAEGPSPNPVEFRVCIPSGSATVTAAPLP